MTMFLFISVDMGMYIASCVQLWYIFEYLWFILEYCWNGNYVRLLSTSPMVFLLLRIIHDPHVWSVLEFRGEGGGWGIPPPITIEIPGTITALLMLSPTPFKSWISIEQISFFNAYPPPSTSFANSSTFATQRCSSEEEWSSKTQQ